MLAAAHFSTDKSLAIDFSTPGRRIFTATSRESGSRAKWTCATEALATGCNENSKNTVPTGTP
jgi:hypothetical protein